MYIFPDEQPAAIKFLPAIFYIFNASPACESLIQVNEVNGISSLLTTIGPNRNFFDLRWQQ